MNISSRDILEKGRQTRHVDYIFAAK